jgi:hypothetical protein
MISPRRTETTRKETDMRHLLFIAVLVALVVSAASGTIVWSDGFAGTDTVVWGN